MGALYGGRCYEKRDEAATAYCGNAFPQFGRVNGKGLQTVTSCVKPSAESLVLRESFLESDGQLVAVQDTDVPIAFAECSEDFPLGPVGVFSLSAADGLAFGAVILGAWASAFAFRAAVRALNVADRDDNET